MKTHQSGNKRKVVIVGAGAVGSTFAYALAQQGSVEEIAIIDQNKNLMEGQVLDLVHGLPYYPPVKIYTGQPQDYADARIVLITAGAKQQPGESRLNLLQRNAAIMENIVDAIKEQNSSAILIIVSNPVDVLTQVALKHSGWPRGRVIGSGTVLDSARFRYLLSKHCDVDVSNVHGYILGEHGDSEFAAWSMTHIGGIPIDQYCPLCKHCRNWMSERAAIEEQVRNSAYHIIDYKGATYYAIGMALVRIVSAILRDQRSVLTVSAYLDGEYDLKDVTLGIPSLITAHGVERVIKGNLSEAEMQKLHHSAAVLKQSIDALGR
jgi:L-lactate dehydrogenase